MEDYIGGTIGRRRVVSIPDGRIYYCRQQASTISDSSADYPVPDQTKLTSGRTIQIYFGRECSTIDWLHLFLHPKTDNPKNTKDHDEPLATWWPSQPWEPW